MKKVIFVIPAIMLSSLALGQVSFSGSYSQDFNTLSYTDSSTILPSGWHLYETDDNANSYYNISTGSNTAGNTYSFGASGNSERAFGGLFSGSLNPTIGANFTNNTGSTLTSIAISYTGELWRCGAVTRQDTIKFQLSTDASSLSSGSWASFQELNFMTPSDTFATGAKNGNANPYQTTISHTVTGISISNGNSFWIRWLDANASGSDDGLSVDDFSMTIPSTPNISVNPSSLDFDTLMLNDTSDVLSYTVAGSNLSTGITITAPSTDFRISLTSGSGYTNTLTLPQSGGSVPPTTIYVIFKPTGTEGEKSGNITNSSTGATTQNVAASGYGTKIRLLSALSSFGGVEVGQTSAEQYYRLAASGLVAESNLTVTAPSQYLVSQTSGTGFSSSFNIRADENGRIPEDTIYVVFSPSSTGTKYDSISHASSGAITRYQRVYGKGVDVEPTVQASNITFSNVNDKDMRVNWTRGNGDGCLVVARCEGPVDNVPWDGYFYPYTAGVTDSFGKGSSLSDGHYIVYKGTGTQVTVRKLYGISTYHFSVFEYNGPDSCENYLTSGYPMGNQITNSVSGKISLTTLGTAYNQDFNALDTATQTLPTGWNYREEGSQANYLYAGGIGASNTGNVYSYGTVPEQAFGTLASGSLIPCLSAVFTNNTGGTLTAVDIGYWGELWRLGNPARYDSLQFAISTTAGNWTANPQLDLLTPDTTGSYGARDGNLSRYRSHRWLSISGLNIANGADFRIRWLDHDIFSYDDGLAVDDLTLIPFNGVSLPRIVGTSPIDSAMAVAIGEPIRIGFSEPMNTSSLAYTCSPDPGGWSASWNAAHDTVTLTHNNFTYWTQCTLQVTQALDMEGFNIVPGGVPNPFAFKTDIDPNAPPMYIWILDVNHGDAIIIDSPADTIVLMDAGENGYGTSTVWPVLRDSVQAHHIHYALASHYHSDHIGGFDEVISALGGNDSLLKWGFDRGSSYATSTFDDYVAALGSKRKTIQLDTVITLGYGAELQCVCVNGNTPWGSVSPTDENDFGAGYLLTYGSFSMTLTGDIGGFNDGGYKDVETQLAKGIKEVSVMKVNHHGSKYSTNDAWVDSLDPKAAVISFGDYDSRGYPDSSTVRRLCDDPKDEDTLYIYTTSFCQPQAKGTLPPGRGIEVDGHIKIEVTKNYFEILNRRYALAVELSLLTAALNEDNSRSLCWRTESEDNTYLWEIERSDQEEGGYQIIGTLPGHGTTSQPHDYQFVDTEELPAGTYWYRLCEVELDGKRNYYGPVSVDYYPGGRLEFALGRARPNPFNQMTTIKYQVAKGGAASLKIYNVLGQEVRVLAEGEHRAGRHQAVWDGRDGKGGRAASGIYFYRLESGRDRASGRLTLLR